ncbi:PE family protein [Mycobacterium riyadhense]|uniref:PE family protein n=1 Tax=Mycobacterium riyadhense TaxID=486698 RepID=UPI00209565C2|nr:PE family protein [Mycobacterium riyadhense]
MASVIASPEVVAGAAADLSALGSTISRASEAAAGVTTAVGSAAADEVSVAIAELFSQHARDYQVLAARAAEFHDEFAQLLAAAGNAYGEAERPHRMHWGRSPRKPGHCWCRWSATLRPAQQEQPRLP